MKAMEWTPAGEDPSWDESVACHPEATLFHTRRWAEVVANSFPNVRDVSRVYHLEGVGVSVRVPLFQWRRAGGLLTTVQSSFPFLYGGPLPWCTAGEAVATRFLSDLGRTPHSVIVTGNPFAGLTEGIPVAAHLPVATLSEETVTTHILELPSDPEVFWNEILTTAKRNDVRRLTRKGVAVETTRDAEAVETVYELYEKRQRTWQQAPGFIYPLRFYREMMDRLGDNVRLYVARLDGRIIGGTFFCRWEGKVHYNAGYFDDEAKAYRPNVLIQERAIRDAIEEGFTYYDMLPSGGLANVETFKESFGAKRMRFPKYAKVGLGHRVTGRLRRFLGGRGRKAK